MEDRSRANVTINGIVVDGLEYNFQFWYRDPGTGANFNLSDGLKVSFCP